MSRVIALVVAGLMVGGCRPDLTREADAAQSMLPVLDNIEARLSKMDTLVLKEMAERIRFQCQRVRADSLQLHDGLLFELTEFCEIPERINLLISRKRMLDAERSVTEQQLHDLQSDLSQGRANKDSAFAFIDVEFLYVEHLSELTSELETGIAQSMQRDSMFRSTMDSLMMVTTAKFVQ